MTPKNHKRAVNRRDSQNKSPKAFPMGATTSTSTWNTRGDPTPAMTHVQSMDNRPYKFVQTLDYGTILTSSSSSDVFYAQSFNIGGLANISSIASLFDQYKIAGVEVWITPTYLDYVGGNPNSVYYSVVDYDDSIVPTAINNLIQFQNCIEVSSTTGTYRRWVPHIAANVGGTTSAAGINLPAKWIDVALQSIPHFGIKVAVKASNVTTYLNMRVRYTILVRNVF
jgi:hypothetical protein